jgi:uncharacterized membrane protein YgdD (TMEM256/DUF423 family)
MSAPSRSISLPRGIRIGAICLVAGYVALIGSMLLRDALAIAILLPLGGLLFAAGILCWAIAAYREVRARGLL